jgi:hypothetical protein
MNQQKIKWATVHDKTKRACDLRTIAGSLLCMLAAIGRQELCGGQRRNLHSKACCIEQREHGVRGIVCNAVKSTHDTCVESGRIPHLAVSLTHHVQTEHGKPKRKNLHLSASHTLCGENPSRCRRADIRACIPFRTLSLSSPSNVP